ncbi:hypothetical protein HPP92_014683 [Vanilla planifolia]|nr:hypothetical protein HPP92_014683 [Vanilla planifolia]
MVPKPIIIFLYLLDVVLYFFSRAFYLLGLNPSFASETPPWENEELLSCAATTPSVPATAASAKRRLPAVEYLRFAKRCDGGGTEADCAVCLQVMETRDKVRVLGNCCHAFHVACIDRWMDAGRFTCPLCRSSLLPNPVGVVPEKGPFSVLKLLVLQ